MNIFSNQPTSTLRQKIKEPCEEVGSSLAWTLRELGEGFKKMKRCQPDISIVPKLKSINLELSLVTPPSRLLLENGDGLAIAGFVFLLLEVVEKVKVLAKEVEEVEESAGFVGGSSKT